MIQDTLSKVVYTADGEQRQWDVPFQFNDSKDLHIYLTDDGVRVEEVFQNFEFNKEGNYFIYPTPESGLAPLEAGKQILILRETPNTQEEDSSEIYFKSKDIERGLDKLTMQVQELARDSYRAVKVSHFDTTTPEDFTEMLFEAGAKAEEAAARAATSESNAALSEQNAASSKLSAEQASASAIAASQLATSKAEESLRNAERAEIAAADSNMHATNSAESASMAAALLQEVSNSIYNKAQVDAKISGLQAEIDTVEAYIPSDTSDSNMLVNKKELVDKETDIREDLNLGLSGLQNQITAQSAVVSGKQDKLIAGPNITINGNVISATGAGEGGSSEAAWGAISGDINAQTDLINLVGNKESEIRADVNEADSQLQAQITAQATAIAEKQDKLTAGEGVTIEGNVISATGGGGGGSAELPDNVYTEDNLIAGENVTITEVLPEGGIDEHTLACWHFDTDNVDVVNGISLGSSVETSFFKFAQGCSLGNVYQTYINLPFSFGSTQDFSFDLWYLRYASNGDGEIGFKDGKGYYHTMWFYINYLGQVQCRHNGTLSEVVATIPQGKWAHLYAHHKAETNTYEYFIDGKKVYSAVDETLFGDRSQFSIASYYTAYKDEVRISDCIRWDEDFTPPTEPYTLATGPTKKAINAVIPEVELPENVYTSDNLVAGANIEIKEVINPNVIDDNTLLCWHFDGDTKDVVQGAEIELYPGYASLNTSVYKFGSGSCPDYLNPGKYVSLGTTITDNDNFTIDYWTRALNNPETFSWKCSLTGSTTINFSAFGSNNLLFQAIDPSYGTEIASIQKTNTIDASTWSHWAFTYNKDNREVAVYANGEKQGSTILPTSFTFSFDTFIPLDTNYNQGLIDELRVTKSLAWEKDFTPPTEAYTKGEGVTKKAISAIIPPVKLPSDVYRQSNLLGGKNIEIVPEPVEGGIDEVTVACWHFDGRLEDEVSGFVPDAFYSDFLVTSTSKFGSGCYNIQYASTLATFNEFDSFAVDFWYKHNSEYQNAYVGINSDNYSSTTSPTNGYRLVIRGTQIGFQHSRYHENNSDSEFVDFPMYSSGIWHHIVVQRIGASILQLFVDGTMLLQKTMDLSLQRSNNVVFYGSGQYFDEIRISHTSRYNEDFTPPTKPYSVAAPTGNMVINGATKTSQLKNDSAFISGDGVFGVKKLTQSEYDALETKNENTLYILA